MSYVTFLVKQLFKNTQSYIPLVLVLTVCFGTLYLNHRNYALNNLGVYARNDLVSNMKKLEADRQALGTVAPQSDEHVRLTKNIQLGEELVAFNKAFAEAFEQGDWGTVYDLEIEATNRLLQSSEYSETSELFKEAVARDLMKYETLAKLDIPYEDDIFTDTATQFTLSLFRYILPALLPVGLAYVLTNLYGSAYEGKLDKNRLLPQSLIAITGKNILVGGLYSLLILLAVLVPVALISGLLYGWGNLNYPILFYSLTTKEMMFSAVGQVIVPTLALHALSLVFMTVLIYLMTILTKNKMTALFISTIVLLSGVALPSVLAPVSAVAHWIPTTYVRSFDITTGVFQHGIENYQVNTGLGIVVLVLSTLVLALLCLLAQKPKNNLKVTV